jgi:hypothetical protein
VLTITSFKHANELYLTAKIPYVIYKQIIYSFKSYNEDFDTDGAILASSDSEEPFNGIFGGEIYVIESLDDLKEISTGIASGNRWLSLAEVPDSFDMCEWIDKDPKTGYVGVLMCWNDAGGPLYFIPKEFVTANVKESIRLTALTWS